MKPPEQTRLAVFDTIFLFQKSGRREDKRSLPPEQTKRTEEGQWLF